MFFSPLAPAPASSASSASARSFFDTMRQRLADQGGLLSETTLAHGAGLTLARLLDRRAIRCIPWRSQRWVPLFQLHERCLRPREDVALVASELDGAMDDLEILAWFACPNSALAYETPIRRLADEFAAVRAAARVDRFLMSV